MEETGEKLEELNQLSYNNFTVTKEEVRIIIKNKAKSNYF